MGGAELGAASGAGLGGWKQAGSVAPTTTRRRAAKPFLTRPPSIAIPTFQPPWFLTTWSRTSAWTGNNQDRLTKSALLAPTRAVFLEFTRPAVSSGLAGTQHRPNGTRHSGDCPKARRARQCNLRSICRSVGLHWCAKIHEYPPCFLPQVHPRLQSQVNGRRCCRRLAYQQPSPPTKAGNTQQHNFFFLGGRLVPTHLQAERRIPVPNS